MNTHSPFPGMDPFLEAPAQWQGVHTRLIVAIADNLADQIAPEYDVRIEERVEIMAPEDSALYGIVVPDTAIISQPARPPDEARPISIASRIMAPTLIEPLAEDQVTHRYIEIRYNPTHAEVIATLEVLSPYNKAAGRLEFQTKRSQVMSSSAHWIEIDLLRAGWRPAEAAQRSDYYALLKRGKRSSPYEVWFFDLRDLLPTIAVPLRPSHEDVPLDLQSIVESVYTRGHYADSTNYLGDLPQPRLKPADQAWAQQRIAVWAAQRQSQSRRHESQ